MDTVTLGRVALNGEKLKSEPGKRLLAFLITEGATSERAEIAAAIWPDAENPRASVRNGLKDIKSVLKEAEVDPESIFESSRESLSLRREEAMLDVDRFRELLESDDLGSALEAIALYQGPFMPGVNDEWVEIERRNLEDDYCSALRIAVEGLADTEPEKADRLAKLWTETSPLTQEPYLLRMRIKAAQNEVPEALLIYQKLAELLNEELAITPEQEIVDEYEKILNSTGMPETSGGPFRGRGLDPGLHAYLSRIVDECNNYAQHAEKRTLRIEPRLRTSLKEEYLPIPIAEFNRSVVFDDAVAMLSGNIGRGDPSISVVLGDYGAGKSSILWALAVRLAREFIAAPETARFPVLVSLRDIGYVRHGWEAVRTMLQRQDLGETSLRALHSLNDSGRIVFLLDGLDELGRGLSDQQLQLSWQRIKETVAADSCAVVTCRSSFFRGVRPFMDSLVLRREALLETLRSEASKQPGLYELHPWKPASVDKRLEKAWGSNWRHYKSQLLHLHPRLYDLATRPGFLQMMIDTWDLLESEEDAHLVDLFTAHTELWYQHDEPRSHLNEGEKQKLLEAIALKLWKEDRPAVDSGELRELLMSLVDLPLENAELKASMEDISVCTQLEWSARGYRFVSDLHLAHALASALSLRFEEKDFDVLGAQRLSPEAATFLAQLTKRDGSVSRRRLLELIRHRASPALPYIGGNAGSLIAARGESLAKFKLQGASLRGAYLSGADLTKADLAGADLSEAVLKGAALDGCNLSRADLSGTEFGHGGRIGIVRFDPQGETFAMGDEFGVVSMWDASSGQRLSADKGHRDEVWALSWSPHKQLLSSGGLEQLLASGGLDREVRYWECNARGLRPREDLGVLPHGDWVLGISWSPDGNRLATSCADCTVRIWQVGKEEEPETQVLDSDVHGVAWHPSRDIVAIATGTSGVKLWELGNEEPRPLDRAGAATAWSVEWSRDGQYLAGTNDDGAVRVWTASTWEEVAPHRGLHNGPAYGCAWNPDGSLLASSGGDHVIRVWKLPELVQERELTGHTGDTWNITWHPDSDWLISASDDTVIRYWKPETRRTADRTITPPPRCRGTVIKGALGLSERTRSMLVDAGAVS